VVAHDKQASSSSTDQGGGKRRGGITRQEMNNSRSDNDQDQQDCKNDPKLAHVALSVPNPPLPRPSLRHKMNDYSKRHNRDQETGQGCRRRISVLVVEKR
jgi:hypothetical protein